MEVKDISKFILNLEKENNLLYVKIKDVFFWKLIRVKIMNEILILKKLIQKPQDSKHKNFLSKISLIPILIYNSFLINSIKINENKEILIFESNRKVVLKNKYIDVYTESLSTEYLSSNYKVEIIGLFPNKLTFNRLDKNKSYFNFSLKYYILKDLSPLHLSKKEKETLEKIEHKINYKLNINLNLKKLTQKYIYRFYSEYDFYNKLFLKRKPKIVFLVCSYGKEALIAACKNNNVKCIEIQHGTISKYHLGYSFPNNKEVPYFPDEMYMFGKYWYESTPVPLTEEKITYYGYPYMEERIKEYKNNKKKKNQILFISQGTIGNKLSETAYEFAKDNKEYNIIYKLHPGEYNRWRNDYDNLIKAEKLDNFKVIDNNKINLYKLLSESEFLIGVYSTAIYEGLIMDCKLILINLPGIDYMDYLIATQKIKIAYSCKDIKKIIKENKFASINKNYFFKTLTK